MNGRHALNFSMILLLCAALFGVPFARASLSGLNDTCIHTFDASNSPARNTRTVWDILSNCGLTLFACTWTAVHVNIPYINDNKYIIAFNRLCLMVVGLIAPETITALAAWELLRAHRVATSFNYFLSVQQCGWRKELAVILFGDIPNFSRSSSSEAFTRWTVRHGFFAYMGGFVLYVDGKPRATLTPAELLQFVRDGSVEMPDITEADIEDRSKGDLLSKCVAILQLVWFVIQIIARYAQNLPVTLLEIDTLAVTAVACVSYCLWLKKPKDIGHPYIVHWNSEASDPPSDDNLKDKYYSTSCQIQGFLHHFLYIRFLDESFIGIPALTANITGIVFGVIHCLGWNFFPRHIEQILWRVAAIGMPCSLMGPFFGASLFLLPGDVESEDEMRALIIDWSKRTHAVAMCCARALDKAKVPTGLKRAWKKVPFFLRCIIFAFLWVIAPVVAGVVTGVCVIASFASVIVLAVIAFASVIAYLVGGFFTFVGTSIDICVGGSVGTIISVSFSILLYLSSRFIILVLMFLSLRSLPPGAYDTVAWSEFIPHL